MLCTEGRLAGFLKWKIYCPSSVTATVPPSKGCSMRFTLAALVIATLAAPRSSAQQMVIEDTNGDGVIDADDDLLFLLPELIAATPKSERSNILVPGVYVNVAEIRGFHSSYLHAKANGTFSFNLFGCTGSFSDDGDINLSDGWFKAGDRLWHPSKLNGHDVLWTGGSWKLWSKERKLYDYGLLVRVDESNPIAALKDPPSVATLYGGKVKPTLKEWRDPFVFGPRDMEAASRAEPSDAPKDRASSIDIENSSPGPR